MCETSQTIGSISGALSKAQNQIKPAIFDSINPHFKSKYATLVSIMEACRPALSANGIAVIQGASVEGDPIRVKVTTILMHVSGEWIKNTLSMKPVADNAQGIGSAITYARRYSLAAMVGIVSDEDDDGESAVGRPQAKATLTPIRKTQDKPKIETPKPEPIKPEPATTAPVTTTPAQSITPPVTQPPVKPSPKQISDRVIKLREVFTLSGRLGQSPSEMKEVIATILKLEKPIKESSEISNDQLDIVLSSFRKALETLENSRKEGVAA